MTKIFSRFTLSFLLAAAFGLVLTSAAFAQRHGGPPDKDHHAGGKVTAIGGNSLTVTNREGETQTINVTANTKFVRNGEAATLSSFQVNDFVMAAGAKDSNGQFVADAVFGGDKPPRGPGRGPRDGIFGEFVSADTSAGTITIKTRDGNQQVVYTTSSTEISRNRQQATLGDFKSGDFVGAFGKADDSGKYVATRIMGGDRPPRRQ